MNALIFPGQGSQIVGMGKEFFNNFSFVKNISGSRRQIKNKYLKNYFRWSS